MNRFRFQQHLINSKERQGNYYRSFQIDSHNGLNIEEYRKNDYNGLFKRFRKKADLKPLKLLFKKGGD